MYNNIFRKPCNDMFISTLLNFVHPDKNCIVKKVIFYNFIITTHTFTLVDIKLLSLKICHCMHIVFFLFILL